MEFGVDYTKNEVTMNNATKPFWGGVYVVNEGGIYVVKGEVRIVIPI